MARSLRVALRTLILLTAMLGTAAATSFAEAPAVQVWYGADGEPLPFADLDEIESFLETAEIVSDTRMETGSTGPRKLLLERDGVRAHAVFKDVDEIRRGVQHVQGHTLVDVRDHHLFDCAAYRLDRLLGLGRVPPAVPREVKGRAGTVILWIEHTIMDKARRSRNLEPPDPYRWEQQKRMMYIFDNLVGNRDSNLGNILIDRRWRLWFIDHGQSFGADASVLYPDRLAKCERGLFRALEGLDADKVRRELGPYLTGPELDALLARRDLILKRLQAEIETRGENLVLFDLRRPKPKAAEW